MTQEFQPAQRIGPFALGEIPDPLQITFKDNAGVALDLSAGHTPTVQIVAVDQTVPGLGAGTSAFTGDGSDGVSTYTWVAADFATAGFYRGQMWSVRAGVKIYASDVFEWFVEQVTTAP